MFASEVNTAIKEKMSEYLPRPATPKYREITKTKMKEIAGLRICGTKRARVFLSKLDLPIKGDPDASFLELPDARHASFQPRNCNLHIVQTLAGVSTSGRYFPSNTCWSHSSKVK